jgi:tetratricopeptide (TPR) repeat protein
MMKEFAEVNVKTQATMEGVDFTSSGELAQANRGDALAAPAFTEISHWQLAHEEAVEYWLTEYQPQLNANNLEKVQGYLEAFYHYCELKNWQKASEIISIRLDTPTNEALGDQLGTWGYYRQQIELFNKLLSKLNAPWDMICWQRMGNAYDSLAEYRQAMRCQHKSLVIAREIGDRNGEGSGLGSLGNAYYSLGE